ncbi:site-specific integrase, partial [Kribbella sp. NPDC023855]
MSTFPGDGWQERWENSGADDEADFIAVVLARATGALVMNRQILQAGFRMMILLDVLRASYDCLARVRMANTVQMRTYRSPTLFEQVIASGQSAGLQQNQIDAGVQVLMRVVLHTGSGLEAITAVDMGEFGEWSRGTNKRGRSADGYRTAVELLRCAGIICDEDAARITVNPQRRPQPSPAELVDRYQVQNQPIRDLLVRYVAERQPAMDLNSLQTLASQLVNLFWVDIERHHPEIDSLHLPADISEAWRHRIQFKADGRPRATAMSVLTRVRAFYLDLQQWAVDDPSWAPWVAPSPVRASDTEGHAKAKRRTTARMHQRIRERLPKLPALVDAAEHHLRDQQQLLQTAATAQVGEQFTLAGITYRRVQTNASRLYPDRYPLHAALIDVVKTGQRIDVAQTEDDAFWSWAVIETLRHTGVRVEELTELTHLAVVCYRLADTGELVPMLQIVPSKTDEERVLLVSPELASVLASIITRLRTRNGGA